MSVTLTSRQRANRAGFIGSALLAFALAVLAPIGSAHAQGKVTFVSPDAAYQQGLSAFTGGHYEIAVPALEVAAAANNFMAQYLLARIYSDNLGARTDHAKAYVLYRRIANDFADIDPHDDMRAPFVAKSFVALTGYLLSGLPEFGVKQDSIRAAEFARHAATYFNDEDAQFELAKLQLKGDGVPLDVAAAKHWLSVLSQKGHASAQAFLADLYWRGKFVQRDPITALSLITMAVENAPPGERIWIEDIYQNIFCGAPIGTRKQAEGLVADWRQKYRRSVEHIDRSGLGALAGQPVRTCANGETVQSTEPKVVQPRASGGVFSPSAGPTMGGSGMMHGGAGFGLHDAGVLSLSPVDRRKP